ncbi:MAG: Two component regulator three Y domain-containing protein [Flavobacteriaceae bacterium]
MNSFKFFIFILVICPLCIGAQEMVPPIRNYKIFEYKAASKNWGLSANEDGELFVANNKGLLHYNGEAWKLYKLPNNTTIRSVASINGKIYSGSYEEFGYWEKNDLGLLEYTSLTHLIKDHKFTSEEFWQILPYEETIVFRSFSGIYIYDKDEIKVINPPFVVSSIAVYEDQIIVAGGHEKLFALRNQELVSYGEYPVLANKNVVDMDVTPQGLLIGTKLNGCYLLKEKQLRPLQASINAQLKQFQLNQLLPLADGTIAFGTIKNGIYLYKPSEDSFQRLNREAGLQNNTVLSMLQFKDQLWLGLDNGIDRLELNNPLEYYTDFSGVVGTVYDLAIHKETLYMGSNTGVYYFKENELHFIEGSQGHVWDLELLDGELFCGHNTGTFRIDNGTIEKVSNISGGYQIVKIPETSSAFLQGTYTGIAKYEKQEDGNWDIKPIVGGLESNVKYLCFEDPETLWVAHPYKGFNRLKLNKDRDSILEIQNFTSDAIPNNYNIKLYNIKNQIVLLSEGIWYKFDPILSKITVFEEFEAYNNKDLTHYDQGYFWFIDNEGSKKVISTDLKEDHFILEDVQLQRRLAPEAENIIKENDSIYLFTLVDGFGRLNVSKFHSQINTEKLPTPILAAFEDETGRRSLVNPAFEIPFKDATEIRINVSAASLVQPRYYYELRGSLEQSDYLDKGTITFQNLPFGSYELNTFTVNTDNERSAPLKLSFTIAPPWYLSKWSLAGYLFILIALLFLVRWLNKRKLEKRHNKLKERLHREQEEHLAQLEKDKLAKEIKLKQKELASTTMNVAKKNELILELKNLLLMNKDKFQNQQRYRLFMKKLNKSIDDTEDWKRFEVNFKELHEDFFEVLLHRYPGLTPKDLKLCAYLKMNLSSKEIAPLMGITTRGVEIHRYRLRKKLNIDGSQNISKFLITLK